jgi:hypothetical protein
MFSKKVHQVVMEAHVVAAIDCSRLPSRRPLLERPRMHENAHVSYRSSSLPDAFVDNHLLLLRLDILQVSRSDTLVTAFFLLPRSHGNIQGPEM